MAAKGADRLRASWVLAMSAFGALITAHLIATRGGLPLAFLLMFIPVVALFVVSIVKFPQYGLYLTIVMAFVGVGLKRYLPLPTGLAVDAFLFLTALIVFFKNFYSRNWKALKLPINTLILLWFIYNVLELGNPETRSFAAWFYAVRGVAVYLLLATPLSFILLNKKREIDFFLLIWFGLSVIGALWGVKQIHVGLDAAESAWLSVPGNQSTHLLFGKLRVFSFYSDAGQFGAAQAHTGLVALILAMGSGIKFSKRLLWGAVSMISFYGFMVSGTRGALAVPVIGLLTYFVLSKNWSILFSGLLLMALGYFMLAKTNIGHNIYEVQRLRAAVQLGSDVPSLQVRIDNQKKLADYLKTRPFGGGVGSAGYWGMRFSPNSFLAQLPLDSWYVKIAAEHGLVGLVYYIGMLLYIFIAGGYKTMKIKDPLLKQKVLALYAGFSGIAVASYANQVLGQMPTGIVIYISIAFIFMASQFDTQQSPPDEKITDNAQLEAKYAR